MKMEPNKEFSNTGQSVLGLERQHSLSDKIGLTLGFLIIGPLLGFFFLMALVGPAWSPVWRWILERFVSILAAFYCSSLIFIWWRPRWLRTQYLAIERKMIQGIGWFFVSFFLYGLAGAVLSFLGFDSNRF